MRPTSLGRGPVRALPKRRLPRACAHEGEGRRRPACATRHVRAGDEGARGERPPHPSARGGQRTTHEETTSARGATGRPEPRAVGHHAPLKGRGSSGRGPCRAPAPRPSARAPRRHGSARALAGRLPHTSRPPRRAYMYERLVMRPTSLGMGPVRALSWRYLHRACAHEGEGRRRPVATRAGETRAREVSGRRDRVPGGAGALRTPKRRRRRARPAAAHASAPAPRVHVRETRKEAHLAGNGAGEGVGIE